MIDYKPLQKTLAKRKMSKYTLITKHFISSSTLQRIAKNQPISLTTIEYFCKILNCKIDDVVTFNFD